MFVGAAAGLYLLWAAYLAVMANETFGGPPRWRIPDVPAGASVISDQIQCGSGGCWHELTLSPAPGQTPDDLARAMGVADTVHLSWDLLDPHTVEIGSDVRWGALVVYTRY